MSEKTLTEEFHSDHTKVVEALMELKGGIETRDPARVRATLGEANKLVGPHFKFEEHHLYPRLTEFLGEARVQKLLTEHDGVFRGVTALVALAQKDAWTEADARSAAANLDLIWEHPITCDGLSLYIERLPPKVQASLLEQMEEKRRQGTTLLEYRQERMQ